MQVTVLQGSSFAAFAMVLVRQRDRAGRAGVQRIADLKGANPRLSCFPPISWQPGAAQHAPTNGFPRYRVDPNAVHTAAPKLRVRSQLGPQLGDLTKDRFRQHMVRIRLTPGSERHLATAPTHHQPATVLDRRPTHTPLVGQQVLVMTRDR